MSDNSEINKKSKVNIEEYYLDKISNHLETISELEYTIKEKPEKIIYINLELHQIFKKIRFYLKQINAEKEIELQIKYDNFLNKLRPVINDKQPDESGEVRTIIKLTNQYTKYKLMCDKREMHTLECLGKLGIIGQLKNMSKRLR